MSSTASTVAWAIGSAGRSGRSLFAGRELRGVVVEWLAEVPNHRSPIMFVLLCVLVLEGEAEPRCAEVGVHGAVFRFLKAVE